MPPPENTDLIIEETVWSVGRRLQELILKPFHQYAVDIEPSAQVLASLLGSWTLCASLNHFNAGSWVGLEGPGTEAWMTRQQESLLGAKGNYQPL